MSDTNLRARLTGAIGEHQRWGSSPVSVLCQCGSELQGQSYAKRRHEHCSHVVDELLKLPDIAIVDPDDIRKALRTPHLDWLKYCAAVERLLAAADGVPQEKR